MHLGDAVGAGKLGTIVKLARVEAVSAGDGVEAQLHEEVGSPT